jgi:hypothetical protein
LGCGSLYESRNQCGTSERLLIVVAVVADLSDELETVDRVVDGTKGLEP